MYDLNLSIITVNLNNLTGLQKTMQSVFEQTFTNYEYIIIDGGSTDGSKEWIAQHADKLAYWVSEKDGGVFNAQNKGIVKSKGEYLLFLNSGDYFYTVEAIGALIQNSNNIDIIYGNIMVDEGSRSWIKSYPEELSFMDFLEDTLPHPASLIKSNLFKKLGLYNEHNKIVSDWEFFMKAICLHNANYKYVNEVITIFNTVGISSLLSNANLIQKEKDYVLSNFYKAFLNDYKQYAECKKELLKIKTSRIHKAAAKLAALNFIKKIRLY